MSKSEEEIFLGITASRNVSTFQVNSIAADWNYPLVGADRKELEPWEGEAPPSFTCCHLPAFLPSSCISRHPRPISFSTGITFMKPSFSLDSSTKVILSNSHNLSPIHSHLHLVHLTFYFLSLKVRCDTEQVPLILWSSENSLLQNERSWMIPSEHPWGLEGEGDQGHLVYPGDWRHLVYVGHGPEGLAAANHTDNRSSGTKTWVITLSDLLSDQCKMYARCYGPGWYRKGHCQWLHARTKDLKACTSWF